MTLSLLQKKWVTSSPRSYECQRHESAGTLFSDERLRLQLGLLRQIFTDPLLRRLLVADVVTNFHKSFPMGGLPSDVVKMAFESLIDHF